jgi:hypothetical protein
MRKTGQKTYPFHPAPRLPNPPPLQEGDRSEKILSRLIAIFPALPRMLPLFMDEEKIS